MFSLTSPRQTTTTKRRNAAGRRVYGKRKADAPRAVFDQKSPPKDLKRDSNTADDDDVVDTIRAKVASILLGEEEATKKTEEKDAEVTWSPDEHESERTSSYTDTTTLKEENVEDISEQFPGVNTPAEPMRGPTVEVQISSRGLALESDKHKPQNKPTRATGRGKRATETTTTKKRPAPRLSSGCVHDEKANEYSKPILNEALSPIAAQSVQKFSSWASRGGNMLEIVKIAEGSYGEVYKMRIREEVCKQEMSKSKLARLMAYGEGVFKVVPLRAAKGAGSKKFTSVNEIVSEVKMLKYLDPIPGFARFREIHVVQGRFPESFQEAWDHYKKVKPNDCLNPNPANKRAYLDSQLWAIIEMDDAGSELEKFSWSSMFQVYDIFWGVAMALARAEEYALFEHRDLHLGNVCIRSTRADGSLHHPTDAEILSRSHSSGYGLSTLETTIIDYSLSRAELQSSEDPNSAPEVASSDLDKKQIFDAVGQDEDEALLRDTYRQ